MYEVCTDDFYHDMWPIKGELELASYQKSSLFYDATSNNVVAKVNAGPGANHSFILWG